MTTFFKELDIQSPKEKVWKVMANLGDINRFNPNTSKSYYSSNIKEGIGAARICELRPTGVVEETATIWNEGNGFTLKITPIKNAPPVKNMYAVLDLKSLNPKNTRVKINMEYETKLGVLGKTLNTLVIKSQMKKGIQLLLEGLKVHLEQGHDITDPKSLKQYKSA
ncbi:SRPBCC family protein [Thalassobellus citreus]|uniref:SRPBCC family protein n=1 Tax=Thalassobellus citreus TaxID=3367752 RepID=UPI0037A37E5D